MDVGIDLFTGLESFTTEGTEDFEERPAGTSDVTSGIFGLADRTDFFAERGAVTLTSFG
jgi:hypothetical protein